jgi:hypothetical protein
VCEQTGIGSARDFSSDFFVLSDLMALLVA